MKLSWNVILQLIATAIQVLNGMGEVLPPKYQALGAGLLAGLQLIVATLAHYSNPDGTPAEIPYTKGVVAKVGPSVRILLPFALLIGLAGCSGNAAVIEALAKDKSSYCASVKLQNLWGGNAIVNVGRANAPDSQVVVTDEQCVLKTTPKENTP